MPALSIWPPISPDSSHTAILVSRRPPEGYVLRDLTLELIAGWYVSLFPGSSSRRPCLHGCRAQAGYAGTKRFQAAPSHQGSTRYDLLRRIGVGLLVLAVSEPISDMSVRPGLIAGEVEASDPEVVASAMRFTSHYRGLSVRRH
jgi:hypothetical protein